MKEDETKLRLCDSCGHPMTFARQTVVTKVDCSDVERMPAYLWICEVCHIAEFVVFSSPDVFNISDKVDKEES